VHATRLGESEEAKDEEGEEEGEEGEAMDLSVGDDEGGYAMGSQDESEEEEEEGAGGSEYEVGQGCGSEDEDEDEDEDESSISVSGRRGVKRRLFQKEKSGSVSANSARRSPRIAAAASVRGTPSKRVAASVRGTPSKRVAASARGTPSKRVAASARGTPSKGGVPRNSAAGGVSSRRSPRLAAASGEEKTGMKRKTRQSSHGEGSRVDEEPDMGVEDAGSTPRKRSVIEGLFGGIKAMMGGGRKSPRLAVAAEREREREKEKEEIEEKEKGLRRSPRLRGR
jgi:hypothetical protein